MSLAIARDDRHAIRPGGATDTVEGGPEPLKASRPPETASHAPVTDGLSVPAARPGEGSESRRAVSPPDSPLDRSLLYDFAHVVRRNHGRGDLQDEEDAAYEQIQAAVRVMVARAALEAVEDLARKMNRATKHARPAAENGYGPGVLSNT